MPHQKPPAAEGSLRGRSWPLSIAPMMDWTDRHYRAFMRRITTRTLLYTEMVTTGAILHGDRRTLLEYNPEERPLALQLGGDDPGALARCAEIGEGWGYDEINLNVGCPSPRVQNGSFGACLMARPDLVARAVEAMRSAVDVPVTVKHRIGIDELDRYRDLARFVEVVASAGADRFIVHARKAWLSGLSPKENRTVPPLRYEDVHRLKEDLPHLRIEINGGVSDLGQVEHQLRLVDGVMIGRAAYRDPYLFAEADRRFYGGNDPVPTRREVVEGLLPYLEEMLDRGVFLGRMTRHLLGLFRGQPGGKAWRRYLSQRAHLPDAGSEVVLQALERLPGVGLAAPREEPLAVS